MAYNVESHANTVADALRQLLNDAERRIIKPTGATVESLLLLFDQIDQQVAQLGDTGMDLRSEQTRWESLQSRLQAQPGVIVRAANSVGGLAKLRAAHPSANGFWWRLDEVYATQMRRSIQRTLITVVVILVVVVGGWQLVNYIFPPDPTAVMLLQAGNQIDEYVSKGDLKSALAVVDQTLQKTPDAPEMLVWSIVLSEKLDDQERSAHDLARAKELFSDRWPQFLTMLGNQHLQLGDLVDAEQNANEAQQLDDKDPQIYLLLASVAEAKGDAATAIDYFQKTYDLAADNPQLQVIARYRMGQLMQSAPMLPTSSAEQTATPAK
ncbi:MAG: tetratricopeptide repeat protein [Caldilineaceae bacterium]